MWHTGRATDGLKKRTVDIAWVSKYEVGINKGSGLCPRRLLDVGEDARAPRSAKEKIGATDEYR